MNVSIAAAALLLAAAAPCAAVELVTNGGFETGTTAGWSDSSGDDAFVGSFARSGSFGYLNGRIQPAGVLSQTLATVAGQSYAYSFWVANDEGAPNSFAATLGGVVLASLDDADGSGYRQFSGQIVAAVDNAVLAFSFSHEAGFWALDDVSVDVPVTDVPEPATWALLIAGFGMIGIALRRRHRLA